MRHEQALVIILSYVIGFTTAFIAFGLAPDSSESEAKIDDTKFSKSVQAVTDSISTNQISANGISFTNTGMFTDLGGEERVISGKLVAGVSPGPGFHHDIPFAEVSPNKQFIYYCEQEIADVDVCNEYIYNVADNLIFSLQANSEKLTSSTSGSNFAWNDDSSVSYLEYRSADLATPWNLQ